MPFNFQLIYLERDFDARNIKGNIDFWLDNMPIGHTPNWVVCKAERKTFSHFFFEIFYNFPQSSYKVAQFNYFKGWFTRSQTSCIQVRNRIRWYFEYSESYVARSQLYVLCECLFSVDILSTAWNTECFFRVKKSVCKTTMTFQ